MKLGASCTAWIAAMAALVAGSTGCSALSTCDMPDEDAQVYAGGTTSKGFYMSSPWDGPLLAFPAGKRYDLLHGLGCRPADLQIWVSFSEWGASGGSNVAPSAGNMSIVEMVDERVVRVKNDTCSDTYLLVTAQAPTGCEEADAGGDAGAQGDGANP